METEASRMRALIDDDRFKRVRGILLIAAAAKTPGEAGWLLCRADEILARIPPEEILPDERISMRMTLRDLAWKLE